MKLATTEKTRQLATIVIETKPLTSKHEKADDLPGLPCFISAARDLKADRCLDQRLSYGGTLAKATFNGVNLLLKSSAKSNLSGCHLSRYYWYHGVIHEVCAIHNGRVWLRPLVSKQLGASISPHDAPRSDHDLLIPPFSASTREPAHPVQVPPTPLSRSSLARQPEEIKCLIGMHAELWYYGNYSTKNELSRLLQSLIRGMNQARSDDEQLKVPALKTICLLIDDFLDYSLRQGFTAKHSRTASVYDVDTQPLEGTAMTTTNRLKDTFDQ